MKDSRERIVTASVVLLVEFASQDVPKHGAKCERRILLKMAVSRLEYVVAICWCLLVY